MKIFAPLKNPILVLICTDVAAMIAMLGAAFLQWSTTKALLVVFAGTFIGPYLVAAVAGLILGIGIMTGKIL